MTVRIYNSISQYHVDVYEGITLVDEFSINVKSDNAIQQVRDFVAQYDYTELSDELGIISW